ncbi:MAG TPA: NUDIX domain-containing protein, partial [Micromonosporaceae bacterium]
MTLHEDAVKTLTAMPAGEFRSRTLDLLALGPAVMQRQHVAGHITASTMIVHEDRQRVLLCLHGRFHRWLQLGGHCEEGDETLVGAALREATEESGIDGLTFDPVPIGVSVFDVPFCKAGPTVHYDVRFAALAPAGAIERVSPESKRLGWFEPGALPSPLASATEELVAPAL